MTHSARKLIEEFDALPEEERSEVLAELARRAGLSPHDLPRDEDLLAAADQLCVELDRRESSE
jgi:DNA-directed RNA polymerase subunit H (RpoH/RPB5)